MDFYEEVPLQTEQDNLGQIVEDVPEVPLQMDEENLGQTVEDVSAKNVEAQSEIDVSEAKADEAVMDVSEHPVVDSPTEMVPEESERIIGDFGGNGLTNGDESKENGPEVKEEVSKFKKIELKDLEKVAGSFNNIASNIKKILPKFDSNTIVMPKLKDKTISELLKEAYIFSYMNGEKIIKIALDATDTVTKGVLTIFVPETIPFMPAISAAFKLRQKAVLGVVKFGKEQSRKAYGIEDKDLEGRKALFESYDPNVTSSIANAATNLVGGLVK